ncbi:MAG: DUF1657 domain-containing protein [Bacillota bacterium]|jgi:hypothetical protein
MTVGTKLHQSLASLRSEAANLQSYALDTEDQQARQMYHQCSQQLEQVVKQLEARVNYVEQQEPTYKISNMQQGQGGGQTQTQTNAIPSMPMSQSVSEVFNPNTTNSPSLTASTTTGSNRKHR